GDDGTEASTEKRTEVSDGKNHLGPRNEGPDGWISEVRSCVQIGNEHGPADAHSIANGATQDESGRPGTWNDEARRNPPLKSLVVYPRKTRFLFYRAQLRCSQSGRLR